MTIVIVPPKKLIERGNFLIPNFSSQFQRQFNITIHLCKKVEIQFVCPSSANDNRFHAARHQQQQSPSILYAHVDPIRVIQCVLKHMRLEIY